MRKVIFLYFFLYSFFSFSAEKMTIEIPFIDEKITLDGAVDESTWLQAFKTNKFFQISPGYNTEPSRPTELYLFHNGKSFFIGFKCFQPKGEKLELKRARRDEVFESQDCIIICFDTFFQGRDIYLILLSPSNDITDGFYDLTKGESDFNFNFEFNSKTKIADDRWEAEIEIPFAAINYPKSQEQKWYLSVQRCIKRKDLIEKVQFCPENRESNDVLDGFAIAVFNNIQPSKQKRFHFLPTLFCYGDINEVKSETVIEKSKSIKPEAGLAGSFAITSNALLKFTINPDFSQIEADYLYSKLNNRYPVYLEEKRPFFLDGMDSFATNFKIVHTRKIVDPFLGLKFSLKKEKYGIYLISSWERSVPNERFYPGWEGKNDVFWNIFRTVFSTGSSSHVGLIFSQRNSGDIFNRLISVDGIQYWKKLSFKYQGILTQTTFPENSSRSNGNGGYFLVDYKLNEKFSFYSSYSFLSPEYRCDSGFMQFNDYKKISLGIEFNHQAREEKEFIKQWYQSIAAVKIDDYSGANINKYLSYASILNVPLNFSIYNYFNIGEEGYLGKNYRVWETFFMVRNIALQKFQPRLFYRRARVIVYNPLNARVANKNEFDLSLTFDFGTFNFYTGGFYERIDELRGGDLISDQIALYGNFYYFLSQQINLRLIIQKDIAKWNDYNYKYNYWLFNFLFTYQKDAFTCLYLGITNTRNEDYQIDFFKSDGYQKSFMVFLKIQYSLKF